MRPPLLVRVQATVATLEINVKDSDKATRSTAIPSCTTCWHIPKGLNIQTHRYLLNDVHCCSHHNCQKWKELKCSSTDEAILKYVKYIENVGH